MKTSGKILSVFLSLLILLSCASMICASAETYYVESNIKFTRSQSNDITVYGYVGKDSVVTIPKTLSGYNVENIGEYAFLNNTKITGITIPTTMKNIGQGAFYGCTSLKSISLPVHCINLGPYLFYGCTGLESATLSSVTIDVPRYCFSHCTSLKTIKLPSTVKTIGDYAFADCLSLREVHIPRYVTSISDTAFANSPYAVIYGYTGTYAETYAREHNIAFCALDQDAADYIVTYYNYDGSVYWMTNVQEGNTAMMPSVNPTKPSTDTHYYEFRYWQGNITNVQQNEHVYPVFAEFEIEKPEPSEPTEPSNPSEAKSYYVVFLNSDGTFINAQLVKEGGSAVAPADPEKAADAQYTYTFAGWDTEFDTITANTVITAQYEKFVNSYTVTFVDYYGATIDEQTVAYGAEAVAPEAPHVDGFTFTGWDTELDYVTKDITVKATYKKNPTPVEPATTGNLKIEVAGGTGFTISIDGGAARPQGTSYYNTSAPIGAQVTVTATTTNGNEFIGWVDPANGAVLSTDLSYTFYASGNDFIKAMYKTDVEGVNMVMFYNDRLKQQWDVQYYAATDSIVFPATDPMAAGYDFVGWNMTEAEIQAELAKGNDVTVLPVWERQLVYVTLDVTGGTVTAGTEKDGKYLANSKVTVTADTAPAGQKFAYWTVDGKVVGYDTTYSFFPKADAEVAAVFVAKDATVEYETLVEITSFTATQYGQFNFAWYVPTTQNNLTYIGAGIVAASEANYKEADFYHGTTNTSIYDRTTDTSKAIGSGYWIGPVMSGETWYAKAWVQYRDNATNEIVTVYSDLFTVTKE